MQVSVAYFAVLLIWSTTPLGIIWSSESINPTMAVLLRMLIAIVLGALIIYIKKIPLPWHKQALRLYSYSALGIFGGMLFSYLAAGYLSSGLMSLIFGLAPVLSTIFSQKILAEPQITAIKKLAMLLSFIGLAIVSSDNFTFADDAVYGLIFIFIAVSLFSLSGVLVKSISLAIHPMATTIGALTIATPLFFICWLLSDGYVDISQWQAKSIWATLYLGFFGSLIGFVAYFYVLQRLTASTVALITLVTPVIALTLGALLNDEDLNSKILLGAALVLSGLALYHWGEVLINKKLTKMSLAKEK